MRIEKSEKWAVALSLLLLPVLAFAMFDAANAQQGPGGPAGGDPHEPIDGEPTLPYPINLPDKPGILQTVPVNPECEWPLALDTAVSRFDSTWDYYMDNVVPYDLGEYEWVDPPGEWQQIRDGLIFRYEDLIDELEASTKPCAAALLQRVQEAEDDYYDWSLSPTGENFDSLSDFEDKMQDLADKINAALAAYGAGNCLQALLLASQAERMSSRLFFDAVQDANAVQGFSATLDDLEDDADLCLNS
jgi:hypothetical protein